MPTLTKDELVERVDRGLESLITTIRVTERVNVSRADLLRLICRRSTRNVTQQRMRAVRSDQSGFASTEG